MANPVPRADFAGNLRAAATWALAATAFAAAALGFALQPFVGRMLAPAAGGGPGVWNCCLVYFQLSLVAGYAAGHFLGRVAPRTAGVALLGWFGLAIAWSVPALTLEFAMDAAPESALGVLTTLVRTVGLAPAAVFALAPILQSWAARSSANPYRLYAASNLGSFAALVSYPILIEPHLRLNEQRTGFLVGLAVLGSAACALALRVPSDPSMSVPTLQASRNEIARWVGWSALPAALLVAATQHLSLDVAPAPLIWLPPLALLLLASTLAFAEIGPNAGILFAVLPPLLLARGAASLVFSLEPNLAADVSLTLTVLFVAAWACYAELYKSRPEPARLTVYYLWLAVGGALGGVGVSLLCPLAFKSLAEYPLTLLVVVAAGALRGSAAAGGRVAATGVLAIVISWLGRATAQEAFLIEAALAAVSLLAVLFNLVSRPPGRMLVAAGPVAMLVCIGLGASGKRFLDAERTFFGVHRVVGYSEDGAGFLALQHGSTIHGWQSTNADAANRAWGYYHRDTSFGQALDWIRDAGDRIPEIAVVGLGAGGVLPYRGAEQRWTFLEIDPAVVRIARTNFRYVENHATHVAIQVGDGRRLLQRSDKRFDAIFLDAFSSDAVPMHLLTLDAFRMYRERLQPGGALLVHVTNWYVDLPPVVAKIAERMGWHAYLHEAPDRRSLGGPGPTRTRVLVVGGEDALLIQKARAAGWQAVTASAKTPLWEDDYCDLWSVLRK